MPLLQAAFSDQTSAIDWSLPLLSGAWAWRWGASGLSRHLPGVGVAFVDRRTAGTLQLGHVGPVGVHPAHRRQGHGRLLLRSVEAAARGAGLDALTLEADPAGPARGLYASEGYRPIEHTRPRVVILDAAGLAARPGARWWWPWLRVLQARPQPSRRVVTLGPWEAAALGSGPPRPGAIREDPLPPPPADVLPSAAFRCRGATVSASILPIRLRDAGPEPLLQLRGAIGDGTALLAATDAALLWGRAAGCRLGYALPGAGRLPRLGLRLGEPALRMLKPLTPDGAQVAQALAYDPQTPFF